MRLFESQYATPDGKCYNSYLILDEKVAVMDTSDSRTLEQWKANLADALGNRQPDYLIVHHLEPDHASGIAEMAALYPQMQIVCSAKAKQMMPQYWPLSSSPRGGEGAGSKPFPFARVKIDTVGDGFAITGIEASEEVKIGTDGTFLDGSGRLYAGWAWHIRQLLPCGTSLSIEP